MKTCVQATHVSWPHLVLQVFTRHVPQWVAQVPQLVAHVPQLVAHVPHFVAHVAQVPHLVTQVEAFVIWQFAPHVFPPCVGGHPQVSSVQFSVQLAVTFWQPPAVNGGRVSHA